MFRKLFKNEWRATWKIMALLTGCVMATCLAAMALQHLTLYYLDGSQLENLRYSAETVVNLTPLILLLYGLAVPAVLLVHYYRSRFTDQGYLTFTLPVKTRHIFLSAGVNMLIWTVLSFLAIWLLLILYMLIIGENTPESAATALPLTWYLLPVILFAPQPEIAPAAIPVMLSLLVYSAFVPLSILSMASCFSRRKRFLVGLIFTYAFGCITVTGCMLSLTGYMAFYPYFPLFASYLGWSSVALALIQVAIAGYLLSTLLMKKKLNFV